MRQDNDLVVCQGLTKRFGSFTAVDHISFEVGQFHCRQPRQLLRPQRAGLRPSGPQREWKDHHD